MTIRKSQWKPSPSRKINIWNSVLSSSIPLQSKYRGGLRPQLDGIIIVILESSCCQCLSKSKCSWFFSNFMFHIKISFYENLLNCFGNYLSFCWEKLVLFYWLEHFNFNDSKIHFSYKGQGSRRINRKLI